MTEKGKAFLAEASRNEELKTKLAAIDRSDEKASIQKAIRLAKEYGFELIEEDLTVGKAPAEGAVADDELDNVAGGMTFTTSNNDGLGQSFIFECLNGGQNNQDPPYLTCACMDGLGTSTRHTHCDSANGGPEVTISVPDSDGW